MSLPQGINFRGSAPYATDGADEDYELSTSANYPRTSAQGNSVGWEDAIDLSLNRDNSVNDRIRGAGFTDHSGGAHRYRIDVGSSGDHLVKIAMGDVAGAASAVYAAIHDGSGLVSAIVDKSAIGSNVVNESNTIRTPAQWASEYAASGVTVALSDTICRVVIGDNTKSGWCPIAHFYIESVGGGGPAAELEGDATAQATATGALSTEIPLAGGAAGQAAATGDLATGIQMGGAAAGQASAAGSLETAIQLAVAAIGSVASTGALSTEIRLQAAALAEASAAGGLTTEIRLAAAAVATGAAAGSLATAIQLAAAVVARASAAGVLTTEIRLLGAAVAQAMATGTLSGAAEFIPLPVSAVLLLPREIRRMRVPGEWRTLSVRAEQRTLRVTRHG